MGIFMATRVAQAEPSDADRATARVLAHEGFDAQQRGDYSVAADRFLRADALVHAPTLLLGLARAQVGLGGGDRSGGQVRTFELRRLL
jgi:hypothetical protein